MKIAQQLTQRIRVQYILPSINSSGLGTLNILHISTVLSRSKCSLAFVSMQGKKTRNNRGCSVFYSCMACTNQYGTADLTYLIGTVHGTWRNKHDRCLIVTYSSVFFCTFT